MKAPVRIIHLEDTPNDSELVRAALDDGGFPFEVTNVSTREEFVAAIGRGAVDLILSDYALPAFDGLSALAIAQDQAPDVPFILVSGTMGEEAAIDSLRSGATDYVLKHRLTRLVPAVRRALEEAAERRTRRATEEMLGRERTFLRALLDSLEAGVVACDSEGTLTLFNRATRELHGLPEQPLSPDQWASHFQLFAADGSTLLLTEEIPLHRALRGERLRNVEVTIRHRNGAVRSVLASGQPITDDHGRRLGGVVALHDITGRKELEAQFRQSQKMEAMGMLAAGVAHDFNNILTVITGFAELLRNRLQPPDPGLHDLEEIVIATQRATDLTRQLLAFSRRQVLEPRVLDLNAVVVEVQGMLQRLIGSSVELVFTPDPELGRVRADAGQIQQVLMNLVINARDAMPQGGRISIRTTNTLVGEARPGEGDGATGAGAASGGPEGSVRTPLPIPPGRYVALSIGDTGCGMDAETAGQIFVPFFTTKDAGRGTGLGLSTVHGIVTQSEGHISLETAPGAGTTFTIHLPLVSDARGAGGAEEAPGPTAETILVLDDDQALRALLGEILRRDGYSVIEAEDADTAVARFERGAQPIAAMIVDLAMPGVNVHALGSNLRRLQPGLPIVCVSGHGGREIEGVRASLGFEVSCIQKPFTPDELRRKVREALNGPSARAA